MKTITVKVALNRKHKVGYAVILLLSFIVMMGCGRSASTQDDVEQSADSIYAPQYIRKISITEPHRALQLLDEAQTRKRLTPFYLNYLRSLVYQNGLNMYRVALTYSLHAYQESEAKRDAVQALRLLEMIAEQYYCNGNSAASICYAIEGIELAKQTDNVAKEASLLFYVGQNKRDMGMKEEAYEYIDRAITLQEGIAKGSHDWHLVDNLIFSYGQKITCYYEDGKDREAIEQMPRYEQLMEQLETCPGRPDGICDMRRASQYAVCACCYYRLGEAGRAEEFYRKYRTNPYTVTSEGESQGIDYLLLSKQYEQALYYSKREHQYLQEQSDTVSYDYLNFHLAYKAQAYRGMGNDRELIHTQDQMLVLTDSLRQREKQNAVLELATIYETGEKEALLQEQKVSLTVRNVVIVAAVLVILLMGILVWRTVHNAHVIKEKNRVMVKTIREQLVYKEEAMNSRAEIYTLGRQLKELRATIMPESEEMNEVPEVAIPGDTEVVAKAANLAAFERLNYIVITEKLYLNPDLSRDDLMRLIHVNKNSIAQILQDGANVKLNEYINNLRIDYAVHLICANPDYSFDAIGKSAGFAVPGTFYAAFKKKTGMNPKEYRATVDEVNS